MIPHLSTTQSTQSDYTDYLQALAKSGFGGDISTDFGARLVSATDNSIYQILPAAVLFPRSQADVVLLLRLAGEERFRHVRFSARGAGTGTNGQSLTGGIILDFSRHMTRILEINFDEGWVRVEPGVVRDQLNEALAAKGFFFAPTLSPTNRATLGGMISTDACGEGSRVYGRTSNHVLGLNLVLADGTLLKTSGLNSASLGEHKRQSSREGEIYSQVDEILTSKAQLIEDTFPKMRRFLTGYNLAHVYDGQGHFHLDQLVCGAEGSLAVVTEARLKLTLIPKYKILVATKYDGFNDALTDAMALLASEPTAIETVDEKILEMARKDAIYYLVKDYIADEGERMVRTINLVEYSGSDLAELEAKVSHLKATIDAGQSTAFGYYVATEAAARNALWDLRKKGVGLLGNMPGDRKPIAFVEDTAVPPENLAAFIGEFRALLDGHGLQYAMYGHIDVGCLHVRPALDMRQERDVKMIRQLSDQVVALVRKYGGIMWAEHGKGFRSEYTPLFFGEALYHELRRIKQVFDPYNQMNPGKVVTPLSSDEGLVQVEAPLKGQFDRQVVSADLQSFDPLFGCNGNGVCFNADAHYIMCPSSKVTRDRIHSPKGRAALLREWLRRLSVAKPDEYQLNATTAIDAVPAMALGKPANLIQKLINKLNGAGDYNHEVRTAMSGCLSCKACATQCPIHVDIPAYKASFLELYHTRYPRPLRDYLVAGVEKMLPIQARFSALVNLGLSMIPNRLMGKTTGLIDAPKMPSQPSAKIMRDRGLRFLQPAGLAQLTAEQKAKTVLLLPDAFTFYYDPRSFWASHDLLQALGWQVQILPYRANGKPMHIKGFLKEFREVADGNDLFYRPYAESNLPVVCVEPSVALTWRDEYSQVLGRKPALAVALLQEWLSGQAGTLNLPQTSNPTTYYLLGHCMERTAQLASGAQWQAIFKAFGLKLELLVVGCCGMAGTFGHEVEHVEESRGIFAMSWEARIKDLPPDRVLVTGYSCRTQVARFAQFKPIHPLEALLGHLSP